MGHARVQSSCALVIVTKARSIKPAKKEGEDETMVEIVVNRFKKDFQWFQWLGMKNSKKKKRSADTAGQCSV